jgi:hypothetical protein
MSDNREPAVAPKIGMNTWIQTGLSSLAMLAVTALALTSYRWIGFGLGAATLLALVGLFLVRKPGGYIAVQLLVLFAVLVYYDRRPGITALDDRLLIATGIVQMGMLFNQSMFKRIVFRDNVLVANLPGAEFPTKPLIDPEYLFLADLVLVVLLGIAAALNAPGWPIATATSLVASGHLVLIAQAAARRRHEHVAQSVIHDALERYRPTFALYFTAPASSQFQVDMWLPYLEKLNQRFVLILRETHSLEKFASDTKAPIIVCRTMSSLENVVVQSLKAVFYVNNGIRNTQMVRFHQLTHIQMLHGDSDKSPSYNPVTAMFDRVYVAGQAGIDRYAEHNVHIDADKFVIVGRPQVSEIEEAAQRVSTIADKTVLYAPTWAGYFNDTSHTSLEIGGKIVREILDRGVRVIYRTHPYTGRYPQTRAWSAAIIEMLAADQQRTDRGHLFGTAANVDMTLFGCFNACDAAIADVSGVSSDFLYAAKPLAMTDALDEGDDFVTNNPLARATYVIAHDGANISTVIDALIGEDPLEESRRRMKRYVLGDFPSAHYEDAFLNAALHDIGANADFVPGGYAQFIDPANTVETTSIARTPAQATPRDGELIVRPR